MLFRSMSPSETTGNSSAAHTQCFTDNAGLRLHITVSAFPTPPHSDSGEGDCFRGLTTVRLRYDLLLCLPSLSELTTRFSSSQRGRLLPGFRRFGHPRRRRISLQCQLGNLHWRDFHPLDHRLASLHYTANLCPIEFDAAKSDSRPRTTILHKNAGGCKTSVEPNDNQLWRPAGLGLEGLSCKTNRTKRKNRASLLDAELFSPWTTYKRIGRFKTTSEDL
jgi:hypothetical protein